MGDTVKGKRIMGDVTAAEDLPIGRFVKANGELCGAGEKALGVTLYDFADGEQATYVSEGEALVEAGGAFSIDDLIQSDADGKAVAADIGAATSMTGALIDSINGRARAAAVGDGGTDTEEYVKIYVKQ